MTDDDEHPPIFRGRTLGEGASDTVFCRCVECTSRHGELEEPAPIKQEPISVVSPDFGEGQRGELVFLKPKDDLVVFDKAKIVDGEVTRS